MSYGREYRGRPIVVDQEVFDHAYEERERRRAQLTGPDAAAGAESPASASGLRKRLVGEAERLGDSEQAVAFGRTDDEDEETFYIGYDLITDEDHDPLVISWKSGRAVPYFQASLEDPMGLVLRRAFEVESNTITQCHDELFGVETEAPTVDPFREFLLRENAGHRSGRMRDVVKTLQTYQDQVMRLPADQVLIVDGGPGSGKTIVGLQRISVLLYRNDVAADDVAFVGPTPGYMRYVSTVLPSLGDDDVRHLSLTRMAPSAPPIRGEDPPGTASVKGDSRLRELIARAVADRRKAPEETIELAMDGQTVRIGPDEIWPLIRRVEETDIAHNPGRRVYAELIGGLVSDRTARSATHERLSVEEINASQAFRNLLNRTWPRLTPQEALRDLLSSERRLKDLSWSLFDADEVALLFRPAQQRLSDEQWTYADIALLDGFADELSGTPETRFRHMVIDEAQDLTPMQIASIRRRSTNGAMTLLGDIGQGFGPFARRDWDSLLQDFGLDASHVQVTMDISFRVPASIMEVAEFVARDAPIPIRVPTPIQEGGGTPKSTLVDASELRKATVAEVRSHLSDGLSVGVIVANRDVQSISAAFEYEGIAFVDGRSDLSGGVTIVRAPDVRGLEFDACVVVEPARIAADAEYGINLIYVTVTRPTKRLSIVHSEDLPEPLASYFSGVDATWEDAPPAADVLRAESAPGDASLDSAGDAEPLDLGRNVELRRSPRIERALSILRMVAKGHTYDQIVATIDDATYMEIFNAADLGHEALASSRPREQPAKAGASWEAEEDDQLIREVTSGSEIDAIAEGHQRSRGAIVSRINRLVARGSLASEYLID